MSTDYVRIDYRGPIVSTNAAYKKTTRGFGLYMSREGKAFKEGLAFAAKRAMRGKEIISKGTPVSAEIDVVFRDRRPDLDGPIKLILDAMNKIVWDDDRQIVRYLVQRFTASHPGNVGVSVRAFALKEADLGEEL